MNFHKRNCDRTGREILSNISPDKPLTVYDINAWWEDSWDQHEAGLPLDFQKTFFEQFAELLLGAPIPSLHAQPSTDENCTYTNYALFNKNCYLIFHANGNEDCLYGFGVKFSKNAVDVLNSFDSEIQYECIDCEKCYNLYSCKDCENCADSLFLDDCIGCKNCIACHNLRNAEFCIFNEKTSKQEFEKLRAAILNGSHATREEWRKKFESFLLQRPRRATMIRQCENCSGDHLYRCQNVHESYDIKDVRDGKFLDRIFNGPNSDLYDVYQFGVKAEMCYECSVVGINANNVCFSALCRNEVSDILYSFFCQTCKHCFGCVGLHNQEYCILNKQYSKEDYETLVPKIIEHMQQTGEWGEFFPAELSPFSYNETIAQEHFPMTQREIEMRGWEWRDRTDEIPKVKKTIPAEKLPDNIADIPDDVIHWAIECEITKRPFRVTKQELAFYRTMRLPVPHLHPDERHKRRTAMRNPRRIWKRQCAKCNKPIETTYSPERPEIVYCEECYLREVY
ncbi:MAG: hypothetical protein PHO20_00175 [Candidatus Peribacteraceae bacterium]|nr:hypothetical protein [Candidatus Peribacteraceae bacterium]